MGAVDEAVAATFGGEESEDRRKDRKGKYYVDCSFSAKHLPVEMRYRSVYGW